MASTPKNRCAVDFSDYSLEPVKQAVALSKAIGVEPNLLHICQAAQYAGTPGVSRFALYRSSH